MFKWLNKQGVQSDKGYIVQVTGRFTIEYREKNKVIEVYVEPGILDNGRFCTIIEPHAFHKWDDGTPINKDRQMEILKNFTDAMEFQNIGVVVHGE